MSFAQLAGNLRVHVERLASAPRAPGTEEHRQARVYIKGRLERAGFTVEERSAAGAGVNLLTRPLPDQPGLPLVIIGAHYDSIPGSPGADDNASAVAALLELAAWAGPRLASGGPYRAR